MHTGGRTLDRRAVLGMAGAASVSALAGCSSSGSDDSETDETDDAPDPESVSVADDAAWRTATLTDVTSGEEFAVADVDRPVVVHTFATDCAVCQAQHGQFEPFYAATDVEIVDLTIDPHDDPEELRAYAEEEGYDWRFGTTPEAVTGSLIDDFGREVTSSASSPIVFACPDGEVFRLEKIVDAGPLESALADVC